MNVFELHRSHAASVEAEKAWDEAEMIYELAGDRDRDAGIISAYYLRAIAAELRAARLARG